MQKNDLEVSSTWHQVEVIAVKYGAKIKYGE
jgi:hypothetical protein